MSGVTAQLWTVTFFRMENTCTLGLPLFSLCSSDDGKSTSEREKKISIATSCVKWMSERVPRSEVGCRTSSEGRRSRARSRYALGPSSVVSVDTS